MANYIKDWDYWKILISILAGCFIVIYVIILYNFNHFESVVVGMITMLFIYIMLRLNHINKKLDDIMLRLNHINKKIDGVRSLVQTQ